MSSRGRARTFRPLAYRGGLMVTLRLLLLVCGFISLVLAAFGVVSRVNLGWLGLALWLLGVMLA